ncbi:MAG: peptidoglycan-binding protein, partial [Xanthobacteraceae bacterium]
MDMRVAAIIVGLIAAGAPALAKESHIRKPVAAAAVHGAVHRAAVKKPAVKKSHIAATAAAPGVEQTGSVRHRKGVKAKRDKDSDSDLLATQERGSLAAAANFPGEAVGWRLIEDPATGAYVGLPEKLVPHAGASRTGSRWTSAQGQIQIETFRLTEAALPALFEDEKKASRRQVTSSALKPESFAIVGIQGLKNFVVRADARGSEVRGVSILYDQATEGIMGRVAIAIANAFAGFPDPNAVPPPGMRRMVEYGTAIVVSSGGDLLAPGHVTDECQAITVPGLGHAERVAEDKTNDLALIRLYGARNLVAATLAGDSGQGGQGGQGG